MTKTYQKRPNAEFLITEMSGEYVVYDKVSATAHLLQREHYDVFVGTGTKADEQLSQELFPSLSPTESTTELHKIQSELADLGLINRPQSEMARRDFLKVASAAAALPAILTIAAPQPAAAESLGTFMQNMAGTYPEVVPARANAIMVYTIRGAAGGGGGGGGASAGGTNSGGSGSAGFSAQELTNVTVSTGITPGNNLSITVGSVGNGALPGQTGPAGMGGDNGSGGAVGPGGSDGQNGTAGTADGGGGGGGGESGQNSRVFDTTVAMALIESLGGRGGGGGGGGGDSAVGGSSVNSPLGAGGGADGGGNGGNGGSSGFTGYGNADGGAGGGPGISGSSGTREGEVIFSFCNI